MRTKSKKLLNETTIRRWGALAGVKPLTPRRLKEVALWEEEDEEEEMPPMGDEGDGEEELDMGGGDLGAPAPAEEPEELVQTLVTAIADAIQDAVGVEIEVEGGEGLAEPPAGEPLPEPGMDDASSELDMGGEEEMPPMDDEEPELAEGCKEKMEEAAGDFGGPGSGEQKSASLKAAEKPSLPSSLSERKRMVAEIAKRVARRLVAEARRTKAPATRKPAPTKKK